MECALTLVSAPAGFGKTTLLAQWLAESGTPVAWLSLEPEDNDPVRFLTYLIAALQTRNPQLGVNILGLLEASQSTPMESALIVLSNDIINRQISNFALVLDDYHIITSEGIHRAMAFLIDHLPPQVHLILATRADPPLPLSRLRARGQLMELRTADLRMNPAEANTLIHTILGLDLPDEDISVLESRTEGWATGLQLAALSLHGRRDVSAFLAAFSGSHRYVLDYLTEEVLTRQSAPVLSFLVQTSILQRLSGPLCDAVTAEQGGQEMLESLEQANLFTNALDDERRWYRYHHLFAEVLRSRLQQSKSSFVPELHRRASLWYEQHGQPTEAVSHALAAKDVERSASLIEQYGMLIIARGQTRTLLEWLNALPDALVRTRPLLSAYQASALHLTDQIEEAEGRLHDALGAISSQTPVEQARNIRGTAAIVSANIARYAGDISRYVRLGQQAYELLPESNVILRATAAMQAACSYLVNGDVTSPMEQQVRFAVTAASTSDYPLVHFRSLTMLARLQYFQGHLRDAALTYEEAGQATPGTQVLQVLTASAAYCFGLADLLREWNSLSEAERLLFQGKELIRGKKSSFADDIMLGYFTQARLQSARGEYGEALVTIDAFIHLAGSHHFVPWLQASAVALRVQIALTMGKQNEALHWAEENGLSPDNAELSYLREREYLTLARVLIAQGRADSSGSFLPQALNLLNRLLADAESKARMASALEILVLQALAFDAQVKRAEALVVLERALKLAAPEGYIRIFVDEGAPLEALLREAGKRSNMSAYVATLLAAFGESVDRSEKHPVPRADLLIEPLTEREREVLALLLEGASNREIAICLVLSINTVKRHVYNICGKLGVQSRTQAIVKARKLNLL
jgi:LuxR family maltose regulon positive regulatory protein